MDAAVGVRVGARVVGRASAVATYGGNQQTDAKVAKAIVRAVGDNRLQHAQETSMAFAITPLIATAINSNSQGSADDMAQSIAASLVPAILKAIQKLVSVEIASKNNEIASLEHAILRGNQEKTALRAHIAACEQSTAHESTAHELKEP